MINVGRVLNSPLLTQSFTVYRKSGSFIAGKWVGTESAITMQGVITVANDLDLEQLSEGDRQRGAIAVRSQAPLFISNTSGTSDEVVWHGNRYRATQQGPYIDYGYYKIIAVKMDPGSVVGLSG